MAKKRIKKSRKKSYLKRVSRRKDKRNSKRNSKRKDRRISRRKDKREIKKTRKKRLKGGEKDVAGEDEVRDLIDAASGGNLEVVETLLSKKLYTLNNLLDAQEGAMKGGHGDILKILNSIFFAPDRDDKIAPDAEPEPEHSSEQVSHPVAEPEQPTSLSRLSSHKTVDVNDELLRDTIGKINGHGAVIERECVVVPDGICLWVPVSAGDPLTQDYGKFRKYGPGSLIQEHIIETAVTFGYGDTLKERIKQKQNNIFEYFPSFLLTGQSSINLGQLLGSHLGDYDNIPVDKLRVKAFPESMTLPQKYIELKSTNKSLIEQLLFRDHDERIIDKSELLEVVDDKLKFRIIKLSELFKKISKAQETYANSPNPIPRNWVGEFCRSGTALNIDYLKEKCDMFPGLSLDDSDFGGDITYRQEGESQLTHQSSLSARRVPGNFKQIVEELYELFNRGKGKVSDDILEEIGMDLNQANAHFKNILNEIKSSIDNMEPIPGIYVDVCIVFLLRKLNL